MGTPYYGHDTKRYGIEYRDHDVELVFDKKLLVVNRASLIVDGAKVDKENVFYGDHHLETRLNDGTRIHVEIGSGLAGELTKAELVAEDGSRHQLSERD